jgi:hypothetical protein
MSDWKDCTGTPYSNSDKQPAMGGTSITIHTPNGPVAGTMIGGYATPNK